MPRCRRPGSRRRKCPRRKKPRWSWSSPHLGAAPPVPAAKLLIVISKLTIWIPTAHSIVIADAHRVASTAATSLAANAAGRLAAAEAVAAEVAGVGVS